MSAQKKQLDMQPFDAVLNNFRQHMLRTRERTAQVGEVVSLNVLNQRVLD